jgi:hypothetical protein
VREPAEDVSRKRFGVNVVPCICDSSADQRQERKRQIFFIVHEKGKGTFGCAAPEDAGTAEEAVVEASGGCAALRAGGGVGCLGAVHRK